MTIHYHLRSANPDDLPYLLALIHAKAEFDGCPHAVTATMAKLRQTLFAAQPMAYVLLAEIRRKNNSQDERNTVEPPIVESPIVESPIVESPIVESPIVESPIGFASYHFTYSTFLAQPSLWLDDLFVQSEHRNQAVGTQLIQQLCQIAHRQGCGRIDWTVDVSNQAGIRFYQRMGGQLQTQVHLCRLSNEEIARHVA